MKVFKVFCGYRSVTAYTTKSMFGQISYVLNYFYLNFCKLKNVHISDLGKKTEKISKLQKIRLFI